MPDRPAPRRSRPPRSARPAPSAQPVEGEEPIATGTVRFEQDRDDPDGWTVHVNGVPSSYVDVGDPTNLMFEYHQWTAAVIDAVHAPGPVRALHLGGAGCAFPRYLAATRPSSRQLVLEVDAQLVEVVRRSFGAAGSAGFRLKVADGREGLAPVPDGTQDVVVRDAFAGDRVPEHLRTVEFLREVDRVLAPGGLWVANLADRPPMPNSRAELATAFEVFAHAAVLAEPGVFRGRRYGNALLVASQAELPEQAVVRALSGGVAPARLLLDHDARHFCAGSAVLRDSTPASSPPDPAPQEDPSP
ncbi:spermidine synthase [Kineococcus rhizosphaerae]|uniref:Methyltransferase family protein n=1 Tax=Kineococcus rhizosphaerae TaxID=559628 RepID=A0A2T0RBB3_9ACTN|nr:fused MFS/spermidine synthase [Kineococcus rhizosphaerae]PRY18452.1 methyltransferase family protein [Kineococcus rhizosphaerae]